MATQPDTTPSDAAPEPRTRPAPGAPEPAGPTIIEQGEDRSPSAGSGNTLGDGTTAGGAQGIERRREFEERVGRR